MSWTIDPSHSYIQFAARHMMISKVRGQFDLFDVDLDFDEENLANTAVSARINAASINTKNKDRDNHLKSPDFLNAADYPELIFQSKRVEVNGGIDGYLIGDLTIRAITKEVKLKVDYTGQAKNPFSGQISAGFAARGAINRKDFDLTWNQALETGGVLVGDEINIDIELEIIKQQ
jgi:polyisoprenoid-binding protein YceI